MSIPPDFKDVADIKSFTDNYYYTSNVSELVFESLIDYDNDTKPEFPYLRTEIHDNDYFIIFPLIRSRSNQRKELDKIVSKAYSSCREIFKAAKKSCR